MSTSDKAIEVEVGEGYPVPATRSHADQQVRRLASKLVRLVESRVDGLRDVVEELKRYLEVK